VARWAPELVWTFWESQIFQHSSFTSNSTWQKSDHFNINCIIKQSTSLVFYYLTVWPKEINSCGSETWYVFNTLSLADHSNFLSLHGPKIMVILATSKYKICIQENNFLYEIWNFHSSQYWDCCHLTHDSVWFGGQLPGGIWCFHLQGKHPQHKGSLKHQYLSTTLHGTTCKRNILKSYSAQSKLQKSLANLIPPVNAAAPDRMSFFWALSIIQFFKNHNVSEGSLLLSSGKDAPNLVDPLDWAILSHWPKM